MQKHNNITAVILLALLLSLASCGGGDTTTIPNAPVIPETYDLAIVFEDTNSGTGSVTLSPSNIICAVDCIEPFKTGITVTLSDAADLGSSFKGYGGDEDCLDLEVTMNTKVTCKPLFEINPNAVKYTLKITLAGFGTVLSSPAGIDCGSVCEKSYYDSSTIKLTATPASGNKFVSWSGDCSSDTVVMNSDINCIATFEPVNTDVDLTINFAGGGSGSVSSSIPTGTICNSPPCVTTYTLDSVITLTANAATNNDFAGWSGDCTGTNPITKVTMTTAQSCIATFELKPVVVPNNLAINLIGSAIAKGLVTSVPSGINCGATCTKDFAPGTVVTLTATPIDATAIFTGWGGFCLGTANTTTVTMDVAKDCTAAFDNTPVVTYELTVVKVGSGIITSAPAGINCGATCTKIYDANTVVTLTATKATDYNFDGWAGDCAGASDITTVTMAAAKTCTATFSVVPVAPVPPVATYNLTLVTAGSGTGTITTIPAGIPCGAGCQTYTVDTSVKIAASPTVGTYRGWIDTAWIIDGCSSGTATLTRDINCIAVFEAVPTATGAPKALGVSNTGSGAGKIYYSAPSGTYSCLLSANATCSFTFVTGETVTIIAIPDNASSLAADCFAGTNTVVSLVLSSTSVCTMNFAVP